MDIINKEIFLKIGKAFPASVINMNGECIIDRKTNSYFRLIDCKTEDDIMAKMLEWLSYWAYKAEPYRRKDLNWDFHAKIQKGINTFCGSWLSSNDFEKIYIKLGNGINHELTMRFIESNFDMGLLE